MDASTLLEFVSLLAPNLPPPAAKWNGFATYNFIGGHNDADQVPLDALIKAANDVLTREGRTWQPTDSPAVRSAIVRSANFSPAAPPAFAAMPTRS
jgi:hypothetical protein